MFDFNKGIREKRQEKLDIMSLYLERQRIENEERRTDIAQQHQEMLDFATYELQERITVVEEHQAKIRQERQDLDEKIETGQLSINYDAQKLDEYYKKRRLDIDDKISEYNHEFQNKTIGIEAWQKSINAYREDLRKEDQDALHRIAKMDLDERAKERLRKRQNDEWQHVDRVFAMQNDSKTIQQNRESLDTLLRRQENIDSLAAGMANYEADVMQGIQAFKKLMSEDSSVNAGQYKSFMLQYMGTPESKGVQSSYYYNKINDDGQMVRAMLPGHYNVLIDMLNLDELTSITTADIPGVDSSKITDEELREKELEENQLEQYTGPLGNSPTMYNNAVTAVQQNPQNANASFTQIQQMAIQTLGQQKNLVRIKKVHNSSNPKHKMNKWYFYEPSTQKTYAYGPDANDGADLGKIRWDEKRSFEMIDVIENYGDNPIRLDRAADSESQYRQAIDHGTRPELTETPYISEKLWYTE